MAYLPARESANALVPRIQAKANRILEDIGGSLTIAQSHNCLLGLIREIKRASRLRTHMDLVRSTTPNSATAQALVATLASMTATSPSVSSAASAVTAWADGYFSNLPS